MLSTGETANKSARKGQFVDMCECVCARAQLLNLYLWPILGWSNNKKYSCMSVFAFTFSSFSQPNVTFKDMLHSCHVRVFHHVRWSYINWFHRHSAVEQTDNIEWFQGFVKNTTATLVGDNYVRGSLKRPTGFLQHIFFLSFVTKNTYFSFQVFMFMTLMKG